MARDLQALKIEKWADTAPNLLSPELAGLMRTTGWPPSYGTSDYPPVEVFNQIWLEFSSAHVEVGERGLLEWDTAQTYQHPSYTVGTDRRIYTSVQASGGLNASQDPVTNTSRSHWIPLIDTATGQFLFATDVVIQTGTNAVQGISPAGLLSLFAATVNARWQATTARFGLVKRATATEIAGRTGTGYVTAAGLPAIPSIPVANTTTQGIARRATLQEVLDGIEPTAFVTSATLAARVEIYSSYLFSSDSGTAITSNNNGTLVTLNDSVSNFTDIEIMMRFGDSGARRSVRIDASSIPSSRDTEHTLFETNQDILIWNPSASALRLQSDQNSTALLKVIGYAE